MILDTSAVAAVVFDEPEGRGFVEKIESAQLVGIGAPTLVESAIVLAARRVRGPDERLRRLVDGMGIAVVAFERVHWEVAADAWQRFGRGRHPAQLNFGDCLAYATAQVSGRPLLAKGDDFARTDLELA